MERRPSGYAVENSRGGSKDSIGIGGSRALSQLMPTASLGQRNGDERRYGKHSSSSTGPTFDRGSSSSSEGPSNQKRSAMVVHEAVVTNTHIRTRNNSSNQHRAQTKPPPTVIDLLDDEPPAAPVAAAEAPSLDTEGFYRSLLGDSIVDSQLQGATGPVGGRIPVDRIYLGAFPFESHSPRTLSIRVDANLSECILLGINDCDVEGLLSLNPVEYEKIPFKSIKKIS